MPPPALPSDEELERTIASDELEDVLAPLPVTLAAAVVYLPVLAAGILLSVFWQGTLPGPHASLPRLAEDLLLGLACGLGLVVLTAALSRVLRPLQELEQEFRRVLGPLSTGRIAALAGLSGLAEEALFRGAVQPWLGYVPTSLIFGCLHFVPSTTFIPWTLFAIGAGFLFGWLFELRDSLAAPAAAHVVVNATNLWLITRGRARRWR